MPISATDAFEEAVAANEKSRIILVTLELIHSAFEEEGQPAPVRCVRNTEDFVARLEDTAPVNGGFNVVFKAIPFEIEYPRIGELGAEASLRLDGVNREVSKYLDAAVKENEPVRVIFRGYLHDDPDTVALGPYSLYLRHVKRRAAALEGSLIVADPRNQRVIKDVYDMDRFPALMAATS